MGLAGISVGLGARLPSLHQDDPSKIAAGFGGTLNLVVSMLFIFLIVVLLALPCHLYFASLESQRRGFAIWTEAEFRAWLALSVAVSVAIGYAATARERFGRWRLSPKRSRPNRPQTCANTSCTGGVGPGAFVER
jgi:ABC-2 type transport system permease protein